MKHKVVNVRVFPPEPATRPAIISLPSDLTPSPALSTTDPRYWDETSCKGRWLIKPYFTIQLDNSINPRSTVWLIDDCSQRKRCRQPSK